MGGKEEEEGRGGGRVDRREDLSILPLEIFLGHSHHEWTRFSLLSDGACDLNPLIFFFFHKNYLFLLFIL